MNIHFENKELLNELKNNTIFKTKIGSHMYGLNNTNSDIDYLSIYLEHTDNRESFMWEHHQLQYKDNNVDRNFTTIQGFIRNALTGDSTVNFEVLHSNSLKNSSLSWLWECRNYFINYNIIKSYLGLAKRDLKYWRKDTNNGKLHTLETNKKLSHFVRGVIYASKLLDNEFSLDLTKSTTFGEVYNDHELLYSIKSGLSTIIFEKIVIYFESMMDILRKKLNEKLNNRTIVSYMTVENLQYIDHTLTRFIIDYSEKHFIFYINYDDVLYNALENGITY